MTVEQDWTPQKRDFLQSTGHVLAMGGPGSGKTHVALVKARDEIRSAKLLSGQRILFLSFARPTVARVLEKAKELITADDLRLLDVMSRDVVESVEGYAANRRVVSVVVVEVEPAGQRQASFGL